MTKMIKKATGTAEVYTTVSDVSNVEEQIHKDMDTVKKVASDLGLEKFEIEIWNYSLTANNKETNDREPIPEQYAVDTYIDFTFAPPEKATELFKRLVDKGIIARIKVDVEKDYDDYN